MPDSVDSDRRARTLGKFGLDPSMLTGAGSLIGKLKDMYKG